MAIAESDLEYRLSGGENNTDPNASLGGAMSTKAGGVITTEQLNNIFDLVTGDETKAGDTEYRCIFVKNKHATLTWFSAVLWITQDADSADDATAIALSAKKVNEAAETIENESTAPSGLSFTAPTEKSKGLAIGDIPAGQFKAFWIRRTITAGAAPKDKDTFKVKVEGETGE